jgi:L-malate glycosyltransferase
VHHHGTNLNLMNDKIKILYVIDHFDTSSGGTEGQLFNLIRNLDKNIFDPQVCVFRYISDYFDKAWFPCPVFCQEIKSFYSFSTYARLIHLRDYIKNNNIKIVQTIFNDSALSLLLYTFGLNVKTISTRRDMGFWYTPAKLLILSMNARFVDKYLVNSCTVKKNVMEKERVPERKIKVIYNAHAMDRFGNQPDPDFLSKYDIPPGSRIVGIVSNYRPVKRVGDLIKAFPSVCNVIKDAVLVIIGDPGMYVHEYLDLTRELGIQEHVRVLGLIDRDKVISYLKWFNVGVMCSESEGLSNAIIEYMACGVPVIATDIPSNRELIESGKSGLLYPVGDIDVLSSELILVLEDKQFANRLTERSREQIRGKFDEGAIIKQYQEFYAGLVSGSH